MKIYIVWCTHHKINYEQLVEIFKNKNTALDFAKSMQDKFNIDYFEYHIQEKEIIMQ